MESLLQAYGETIQPVPAPRYKRKLITKEDSKIVSNNQDTCVNEKTAVVVPPPRRKNKNHCIINTKNTILIVPKQQNHSSLVKEIQANRESFTLANSFSNTSFKTKDLVIANQQIDSELEGDYAKSCFHTLVNIEDCDIIDKNNISNCGFKMFPILGSPSGSHIFDSTADNRVLGTTLEHISNSIVNSSLQKQFDQHFAVKEDREKDMVKSNLLENSATIVGVFYKPEFTLKHGELIDETKVISQPQDKDLYSTYLLSSKINYGNKTAALVPLDECKRTSSKYLIKDPEENDSGVYFSDTKSPPHVDKVFKSTVINDGLESSADVNCKLAFYKALPFIAGDTIDNNSEESGTQNYEVMLDYFEGQTVKSFREQIASKLQLSSEEVNKENLLESKKDSFENRESSLSLYLKSMLENENYKELLSPYPLSTFDKDEKSDTLFEEFNESKMVGDLYEKKSVPDTYAVPVRLENSNNNSILAGSNHVDFVVDKNCVNIFSVNIDCVDNFDNNVNVTDCTSKTQQNGTSSLKQKFDFICDGFNTRPLIKEHICNLTKATDESVDLNYNLHDDSELEECDENILLPALPSAQPCNAVASLIEFFENTKMESCKPSCYGHFQSEEDMEKEDNMYESEENDVVIPIETIKLNSMNFSKSIITENTVKGNQSEQTINNGVIISGSKSIEYSDAVQKMGLLRLADTPTIRENDSLLGPKTIYSDLSLEFNDYSIENSIETLGSNNEKELYPTCDETNVVLPLHTYSFQLPIASRPLLDDLELEKKRRECNFYKNTQFNHNLNEKSSNTDYINNTDNSVKTTGKEESSEDNSFCKDFYDFLMIEKSHKDKVNSLKFSTKPNSINDISSDKIVKSKCKLTKIPIVICTDSDIINSSPIGSIELYPSEDIPPCSTDDIRDVNDGGLTFCGKTYNKTSCNITNYNNNQNNESGSTNTVEVVLEKNWGSVGLKMKGDENGVLVSDILAGGAAIQSGLVFKGWVNINETKEEMELFC